MLAHVLEQAGLSTVVFASIRGIAARSRPPRALYCDFPFGRPIGEPNDPAFQTRVLLAGFELLNKKSGPVLVDYPEKAKTAVNEATFCALPPRYDPNLPESVDEMRGLRPAFDRAAERGTGLFVNFDLLEPGLEAFERIANGERWEEVEFPDRMNVVALTIRNYYEQAALGLADHVPGARAAETWFAQETKAGELIHTVQNIIRESGADTIHWDSLLPVSQHRPERFRAV